MKRVKQFFRHHRLSKEWRIVRHPSVILAMKAEILGAVEYLADKRAIKDRFIQFGPIRNESDGRIVLIPASSAGKMSIHRQSLPYRCIKLKAHGQPILEKTREKPMRLSLTISYHYSFRLSMGWGRSFGHGGIFWMGCVMS